MHYINAFSHNFYTFSHNIYTDEGILTQERLLDFVTYSYVTVVIAGE